MQKPAGNANANAIPNSTARPHANAVRLAERASPAMPTGNGHAEPYRHANRYPTQRAHVPPPRQRRADANAHATTSAIKWAAAHPLRRLRLELQRYAVELVNKDRLPTHGLSPVTLGN